MFQITKESLEQKIASVSFSRIGETTTVCSLTLDSGFVVIGQSACIDPKAFDESIGCDLARENALNKLLELEGYHVKETLYAAKMAQE